MIVDYCDKCGKEVTDKEPFISGRVDGLEVFYCKSCGDEEFPYK